MIFNFSEKYFDIGYKIVAEILVSLILSIPDYLNLFLNNGN